MSEGNIKNFFFNKVLFPRKFIINRPGLIINRVSSWYGGTKSRHRAVYYFEDIIAGLQIDTLNEIGKEKTSKLWYKIGKDLGTQYVLLASPKKKIPKILLPSVLEYIFSRFKSGGCTGANQIAYDINKETLFVTGYDNVICRKSNLGDFFAGAASGLLSFILGKNCGAILNCSNCPKECIMHISPKIKDDYAPVISLFEKSGEYDSINFPENDSFGGCSFQDLIRFEKARISENGKHFFKEKVIIPSPIHLFGLVSYNYQLMGYESILKKSIIKNSKILIKDISIKDGAVKDNLSFICQFLSAFGLGSLKYFIKDNGMTFDFIHAPINKYGFLYQALVLEGFLEYIYKKEFKIEKIQNMTNVPGYRIVYTLKNF